MTVLDIGIHSSRCSLAIQCYSSLHYSFCCKPVVVCVLCQYLQGSEVGAETVEDTRGHREPYITQDVVEWSYDAHHG